MTGDTRGATVGDVRSALVVESLSRTQIVMYAGASGDYNPSHTDEVYATRRGHHSVFAHGMLTMGMSGRVLTDWVGEGALLTFGARFTGQVWPGDSLTTTATIAGIHDEEDQGRLIDIELLDVVTRTGRRRCVARRPPAALGEGPSGAGRSGFGPGRSPKGPATQMPMRCARSSRW